MAAVDNISISDLGPGLGGFGADVLGNVKDRVLQEVKSQGWRWYNRNESRVLYTKKIWFYTVSLRVKDLRFVFEELFGEEPVLG